MAQRRNPQRTSISTTLVGVIVVMFASAACSRQADETQNYAVDELRDGSFVVKAANPPYWSIRRCFAVGELYRCISISEGLTEETELLFYGETYRRPPWDSADRLSASSYSCSVDRAPPIASEEFELDEPTATALWNAVRPESIRLLWSKDFIWTALVSGDFGEPRDIVNCRAIADLYWRHGRGAFVTPNLSESDLFLFGFEQGLPDVPAMTQSD